MSRDNFLAAIIVAELTIIGLAFMAVRGVHIGAPPGIAFPPIAAQSVPGPKLIEDGPHQSFDAGSHPALTVSIGLADLTIVAANAGRIDVSVSGSRAYGFFRGTAPLEAHQDGDLVRIGTTGENHWIVGDDRMVTVVVPPETQVTVAKAGDVRVRGLRAEASLTSIGSGSVTVDDYIAPALRVEAKGRITLHRVSARDLNVTSNDSRIEGDAVRVRNGTIDADGRVSLSFAPGSDSTVNAEAGNGAIHIAGHSSRGSSQSMRLGDGDGSLQVHSNDGNITLTQEN